jgi:hypothetical protein
MLLVPHQSLQSSLWCKNSGSCAPTLQDGAFSASGKSLLLQTAKLADQTEAHQSGKKPNQFDRPCLDYVVRFVFSAHTNELYTLNVVRERERIVELGVVVYLIETSVQQVFDKTLEY